MLGLQRLATDPFEYVFPEDPAIDKDHPEFDAEKYHATLEEKHLPLKTGERATKFSLRPLSRSEITSVSDLTREGRAQEACQLAVQYGLIGIKDGPPGFKVERDKYRVKDSCMDEIHRLLGFGVFARLGTVVIGKSHLSPF